MPCSDKYDLLVTYDGVSHGLLCDWTQKGVGLQIDPPQIPQSTQVSTKGNYGVRDANDFFRIVQTDWSEGCGQNTYDSDDDSAAAFLASTHIDISEKGSLRLGPASSWAADLKTSSASCAGLVDGSGNPLVWRGDLLATDADTANRYIVYSKDGATWTRPTAHTYHNTAAPTSLCTDGAYTYGCFGGVVSKSTIADTLPFSTDGSNASLTHVAFASGTLYAANATQLGSFSQVAQPVWTALSPVVGSAINTEAGTTFGLVSSGNYVYWGVTNGMVTKVYKALYAGGAAKDELTAVATFPTGFVGSSLHAYLGTVYVGGHFDAETAGYGIGAIYAIINDSPSLLTNVGDALTRTDKTQKWGVISISSYERSLYFLTGNGHVYRWDLVNGGYSHVMDADTGSAYLSDPASWTKAWTMAAAPASPAVIANTSTTALYNGTLTLSQNYSEDKYRIDEAVAFDDSTGGTLEVDLPANAIVTTNPHLRSGILGFGIFGEVKDVRVRVWTTATAAADYMGEMRSGETKVIASFGPLSRSAATLRLTLKDTDAVLSCDGSVIAHGTASVARDAGDAPGVWIRATDPNPAGNATITDFKIDEVRWSTAGIFDASFMPTITGSSIVCARDKVFALCQDATLGGCQVTSTTEYDHRGGSLTSSKSSGNMPTVDKYFNRLEVQLEQLPTGCLLSALVVVDGSGVGPIAGVLSGSTLSFPVGVLGRNISYTLFVTSDDSLQTPVISEVAVLFTPAPKTARVYTYMVKCWDKVQDNNGGDWGETASVVADFLEEIANSIVTVSRPGREDYTGKVEGVQFLEAAPSRKANGREGLYQISVRNVG